jgi:hypothetical protein
MAKEDKDNLIKINELLDKISKKYRELGTDNPFIDKKAVDLIKDYDKEVKILEAGLRDVNEQLDEINKSTQGLVDQMNAVIDEMEKSSSPLKRMNKSFKDLTKQAQKIANEQASSETLTRKQLFNQLSLAEAASARAQNEAAILLGVSGVADKTQKILKAEEHIKTLTGQARVDAEAALGIMIDEGKLQDKAIKSIKARIELEDKFAKKLVFGAKAAGGIDTALQKAGLPSIGIASAIEKAREEFVKTNGEASIFKETTKALKENLKEGLSFSNVLTSGLVAGFLALKDALKEVDASSGEFAKNQGLSYKSTIALRQDMVSVAASSDDILVNSKDLMQTQATLSKLLGSQVRFSDEMLDNFTQLAKRTNMTEKTQELLANQVLKTGKSAKTLTAEINSQVLKQNEQRKISMSFKEVQDAIGESSKAIRLNFQGSVKELVNQVSAAKALGTNLATVEQISSHLLDFESSIQAELEAELLLGKEINLEKARQAALQGDMATVADEVLKNTAIMNAFETKNVIAQEKAAAALGMSRDDLANMVTEQQQLELVRSKGFDDLKGAQKEYNDLRKKGYSAEEAASKVGDKSLQDQLESASVAEKMEATMARINEIFISIADVILPIVDGMMNIFGTSENLAVALGVLAGLYLTIQGYLTYQEIMANKALLNLGAQSLIKKTDLTMETTATGLKAAQAVSEGVSATAATTEATATAASLPAETTKTGLMGAQAVSATATASAGTLGLGTVGIIAGIAAVMGIIGTYMAMMDDGEIESGAGAGYGKRKFFNKGEITSFNDNDNVKVVAGTNAKETTSGGGMSLSPLITKIDQLIAINQQILAKNPVISMNSNKVSDEMQKSERLVSA